MRVRVEIRAAGGGEPPAGVAVIVQVLDATLQDVDAVVLSERRTVWGNGPIDIDVQSAEATLSVHVDVDGDGKVSEGDFITMQSYPCRGRQMRVEVRKV
jgi:hypothetical protein